jgi:hypothetical protein
MVPLLILVLATAISSQKVEDGCLATETYSPVEWVTEEKEFCTHKCSEICEDKTEEICQEQVTIIICEFKGHVECVTRPKTIDVRDDKMETTTFVQHICEDITEEANKTIVVKKLMPQCTPITKEICDSKWVTNPKTGEREWAGDVNCRDMTWNDCKLVEMEVKEVVPTFKCVGGPDNELIFDRLITANLPVTIEETICTPKAGLVCEPVTEDRCVTLEWKDCKDEVVEDCHTTQFTEPKQEKLHTMRCPLNYPVNN